MEENSKYKIQRTKKEFSDAIVRDVPVISIGEYCKKNEIKKINILKIDTQGSEAEVLRGAEELLRDQLIDVLELEYIFGIAHKEQTAYMTLKRYLTHINTD